MRKNHLNFNYRGINLNFLRKSHKLSNYVDRTKWFLSKIARSSREYHQEKYVHRIPGSATSLPGSPAPLRRSQACIQMPPATASALLRIPRVIERACAPYQSTGSSFPAVNIPQIFIGLPIPVPYWTSTFKFLRT